MQALKPLWSSISRKLILAILVFSTLITILVIGVQIYQEYRRDVAQIRENLDRIEAIYLPSITAAVWTYNDTLVTTQLQGLIQIRDVVYAAVYNEDTLISETGTGSSGEIFYRSFPLVYSYDGEERLIGRLRVGASIGNIYTRLRDRALEIAVTEAISIFLVTGFVFFLVHFLVTRHLANLSSYLKAFDIDAPFQPFSLRRKSRWPDEFETVAQEINHLGKGLHVSHKELIQELERRKKAEEDLQEAYSEMEKRVERRTEQLRKSEADLRKAKDKAEARAAEVRESEEKFRTIFHASPDPVVIVTFEHGRNFTLNEAFLDFSGFAEEQLLGRTWNECGFWATPEERHSFRQALAEKGSLRDFETRMVTRHGLRTVLFSADMIEISGEAYILGLIKDITDRKLLEEQILRSHTELEERVRNRTLQLERANRAKDEFLANMSHEMRTPLAGVFGMSEVLLQHSLSEPVRRDIELIRNSSGTVLSLLNDMLDLSRIEQGKIEISNKPCDLGVMLEHLVRPFEIQAREKGISFELAMNPDVAEHVECDPDRIGQVLKNLLSNAIKFTSQGGVKLEVHSEELPNGQVRLQFDVSDTGIGIAQEKLGDIFMTFTQIDPTYSKKFAGIGLGLAISKRLVDLMHGEISVSSEPGRGSTFTVSIPVDKLLPRQEAEKTPSLSLEDLPPLSILLAEDNPVNRLFMSRALGKGGHTVTQAENGIQVLEKLQEDRFDLILMDIQMPEMDGLEAIRHIRGNGVAPSIPVIALTAYAMKGDREKFLAAGMDGYVSKPVNFEELARTIAKLQEKKCPFPGGEHEDEGERRLMADSRSS